LYQDTGLRPSHDRPGSSESEAANPRGRPHRDGRNRRTIGERHPGLHIYDCL